jgi:tetratricopeptide (TPR) repeat protein
MRNRLKFVALFASICAGAWLCSAAIAADQPAGPQVSKTVAKPLKAAQDAMQAKKLDEALSHVREAQGAAGEKTAYDNFVINILLFQIYQQKQDMADAIPVLQAAAQSQYATADQQKMWLKNIALYYFQQKDYAKALETAEQAIKHGSNDLDTLDLIAKSQYLSGKYKEAAATMQEIVSKQEKPDEEALKRLWQFDLKAGDDAGAAKAVEKLVASYPKPEYWANALAPLVRMDIKDAHLQLNVYRLMNDVGVMRLPSDYAEMAEIALDAGYPGETQAVLQQAFAKNVFVEQRDKDRYQHLLEGAKQRAAADREQLANVERTAETAPNGDALVTLGAAYMSYGQNDKAAAAITKGIAKGGLKSPDEAWLLLGIAQLRLKNNAEAQRSFEKVASSSNSGYSRLGKLWALHATGRNA